MAVAVPCVYGAIAAVSADIARIGIGKDRKNEQQGYKFRGIDEVLNALSPLLVTHKLIILPRVLTRAQTERTSAKGGAIFSVVVEVEFDFIGVEDGSRHPVRTFGEGMDSADKATNKAMSAAYKYAAFQAFCIPLKGVLDDADTDHHEVNTQTGEERPAAPEGFGPWWATLPGVADEGVTALSRAWETAPKGCRAYVSKYERSAWDGLKRRAGAVKVIA